MFFIQTGSLIGVKCSIRNPYNALTMYKTLAKYHSKLSKEVSKLNKVGGVLVSSAQLILSTAFYKTTT